MYSRFSFISLIFIVLSNVSTSVSSAELTGLAIQEKLRVPIYYAATSGLPPKDVQTFINDPLPFKMEARYIVDKFSARRNNQLWLNAILTTNSRENLKTFETALLKFSKLIKIDMFKGDRLVFDLSPVHGTKVSINDVELGTISDLNFQAALVSMWFGDKQRSKKFAEQIRTMPQGQLLEDFNALEVQKKSRNRFKAIQTALAATPKVAQAPTANSAGSSQSEPQTQAKSEVPADTSPVEDLVAKEEPSKNLLQQAEEKLSTNATKKRKQQQPPVAKPKKKEEKAPTRVAKVEPVSVVDQMFNSLRNDYQAELKQYIEQNARPVPPRKVRKKPKGKATLRVTLFNHDGKLMVRDSETISGKFNEDILNSMHESVKRLQSMPPIPEAIADIAITIDVTLDFAKCKRSTSAWICF